MRRNATFYYFWAIPLKQILCYTQAMKSNQHIWRLWSKSLHQWGMADFVASFLEAAGPLSVVGAQAVYLFQPILRGVVPGDQLGVLAQMLEEPGETKQFAEMIRENS